jgi:hypothetical protein
VEVEQPGEDEEPVFARRSGLMRRRSARARA